MSVDNESSSFYFIANQLALDLVNTQAVDSGREVDLLPDFDALLRWCREAGILPERSFSQFARKWKNTAEGTAGIKTALELRFELRKAAEQMAAKKPVSPKAIELLNKVLSESNDRQVLVPVDGRIERHFHREINSPVQLLVPVAEAAADLLTAGDPKLVRKCESPDCILWFYDTTKNHARRWCSMAGCGNRAKASAHYQRKRQSGEK